MNAAEQGGFMSFDESQKIVEKLRDMAGRDFWPEIGGNEMLALVNIAVATWIAKQFNTPSSGGTSAASHSSALPTERKS